VPPAPLQWHDMLAVWEWAAQCHGVDTGLAAQCCTAAGMASPRELVEQRRDTIPRRAKVGVRVLRCQGIKCPYTGEGARAACGSPRARRTPPEGVFSPRARRTSLEGRA
jgi:hypothetical protein